MGLISYGMLSIWTANKYRNNPSISHIPLRFFYDFSQRSNTFVLSLQYQLLNELIWLILT